MDIRELNDKILWMEKEFNINKLLREQNNLTNKLISDLEMNDYETK